MVKAEQSLERMLDRCWCLLRRMLDSGADVTSKRALLWLQVHEKADKKTTPAAGHALDELAFHPLPPPPEDWKGSGTSAGSLVSPQDAPPELHPHRSKIAP